MENSANTTIKLHEFQLLILKNLVNRLDARFNDLLIEGLGSEHMNYHLQKLVDLELVGKNAKTGRYTLTDFGKDYSNLLDDEVEIVEKQPKTSVLLNVVQKDAKTGEVKHLLSKRLRQPYLGKIGKLTGKVRFGETLQEAANRELYEETGLRARKVILEEVFHKVRYRGGNNGCETDLAEEHAFVQDVLFYVFFMMDVYGDFIKKTPHQENLWLSRQDLKGKSNFDLFEGLVLDDRVVPKKLVFSENVAEAVGF